MELCLAICKQAWFKPENKININKSTNKNCIDIPVTPLAVVNEEHRYERTTALTWKFPLCQGACDCKDLKE